MPQRPRTNPQILCSLRYGQQIVTFQSNLPEAGVLPPAVTITPSFLGGGETKLDTVSSQTELNVSLPNPASDICRQLPPATVTAVEAQERSTRDHVSPSLELDRVGCAQRRIDA